VSAFVPQPLPPHPAPEMTGSRARRHEQALLACGRLDSITQLLPEPDLFLYAYIRREPLLYLSLYLKQHRTTYYRLLDAVRYDGNWEAWLDFFLEGVQVTAAGAVDTADRLVTLFREDAQQIHALEQMGIVDEVTGRQRDRVYVYRRYLDILNEGAQPL